jgi:Flp pilus assembly pilin Flp
MPIFGTANEFDAGAILYGVVLVAVIVVIIVGIPFFGTPQLISSKMAKFS